MKNLEKLIAEATPGPWRVCEATIHGRKHGGCWVEGSETDDGDDRPRGMLIPMSGSGGSTSYTTRVVDVQGHDYNDANARLIALAPSLAAALLVAEKALREVAMPIDAMINRLSPGENLSGAVAASLANDPEYLKRIARAALSEIEKLTGGGE